MRIFLCSLVVLIVVAGSYIPHFSFAETNEGKLLADIENAKVRGKQQCVELEQALKTIEKKVQDNPLMSRLYLSSHDMREAQVALGLYHREILNWMECVIQIFSSNIDHMQFQLDEGDPQLLDAVIGKENVKNLKEGLTKAKHELIRMVHAFDTAKVSTPDIFETTSLQSMKDALVQLGEIMEPLRIPKLLSMLVGFNKEKQKALHFLQLAQGVLDRKMSLLNLGLLATTYDSLHFLAFTPQHQNTIEGQ